MSAPKLQWNDLELVLAVCRQGSLSGAAKVLGVNHSTVYRRISNVEASLGTQLFKRLPHGYEMTETGEAVKDSAELVEEQVNFINQQLAGINLRFSGHITIATTGTLLREIIMPHVATFSKLYPDITFSFNIGNPTLSLSRNEAEMAIRVTRNPPETLIGKKLCDTTTTFYGSKHYLSRIEDHKDIHWLMPGGEISHLSSVAWLKKQYPQAKVLLKSNTISSLKLAIERNMGVGPLPTFLGDADPQLERLLPPPPELTYGVWVLWHPDLKRTARLRAFVTFLQKAMESDLARINVS